MKKTISKILIGEVKKTISKIPIGEVKKPLVLLIANYIKYIEENFSQIIDK